MLGRLLAVAAIVIFLAVGVGVLQQGYWSAATQSEPRTTFNNSIVVDNGTLHTLASSNKSGVVYAPSEDITVNQSGTTYPAEGNWTWLQGNGTIIIKENATLTNGTTAFVEGYYVRPSGAQNVTADVGLLPVKTLGDEWTFIGGIMLLLAAIGIMARVG